jgi:glucans biosynthesis protein C
MSYPKRRHDIDNLRIITIGLLLVYHVAIVFQPWGVMIGFIVNRQALPGLWPLMAMLNVWRIPLLFFIAGLGVYFALQNRNLGELVMERSRRIFVPYVFGSFVLVPLYIYLLQAYYSQALTYTPSPGHLWFLGNIFGYVLLLAPLFFWVKKQQEQPWVKVFKKIMASPWGLLLVLLAFQAEAQLVRPVIYEMYALTWHGFFMGCLGFFFGYCFGLSGAEFWAMLLRLRWFLLVIALGLYVHRLLQTNMQVPIVLLVLESNFWVFTLLAFAYKHLNFDYALKAYLSRAAYPVYLLHMVWLYLFAYWIVPLDLHALVEYILILTGTLLGSLLTYELLIKRIGLLAFFFGLKRMR